jgi:hypothetical protein
MQPDITHCGRLLYVALGFLGLVVPLRDWLDTYHGIGLIEHGMAREGREGAEDVDVD